VSLALLLGLILLLFILRVPMAFAILGPCLLYLVGEGYSIGLAFRLAMGGINSWPLLAVPLFILVGIVATRTEIADRLYDAALLLLGPLRAGLAYVNIGVSLGFSWMSGAALADAAGIGSIEVNHMRKKGYPAEFAVGLSASSALISPIMPPSIPAVVYASVAAVSTGALFAAAVIPAALVTVALIITVWVWALRKPQFIGEPYDWVAVRRAVIRAIPPMGAPALILGGILGGFFTPTEAAGIGALYMLALALSYRTVTWRNMVLIFRDTAVVTGQIMLIIGASALLSWILAKEQVPQAVAEALLGLTDDPFVFLLVINFVLVGIGMILEPTSALLIITPILLPVAIEFGIDPLHFGSIIIFNLMIGLMTPPMGGVAFVLSSVTGIPLERVFRGALYYFPALLIALAIVTYVPAVTLWLPGLLGMN
jgi:tripartite ATP-independent transporter DctM subunit